MPPSDPGNPAAAQARLEIRTSRQFPGFLAEQGVSLAITTYQAGKLFLLGAHRDGRLSVFERTLERCMGLHASAEAIHLLGVDFEAMPTMRLYRTSDLLVRHRDKIEDAVFTRIKDLFALPVTVTLRDLTNAYFEGTAAGNAKAARGRSK